MKTEILKPYNAEVQVRSLGGIWRSVGGILSATWRFGRFLTIRGHYRPSDAGQCMILGSGTVSFVRLLPAGDLFGQPWMTIQGGSAKAITIKVDISNDGVGFRAIFTGEHFTGTL